VTTLGPTGVDDTAILYLHGGGFIVGSAFKTGGRWTEGVDADRVALQPIRAEPTQRVTHLTYAVDRDAGRAS